MSDEEIESTEEQMTAILRSDLPLGRIKKIIRMDPEVISINNDAARMITKATELFIKEIGKACYTQAILDKRKTIQMKDMDKAIRTSWLFEFLEESLDGWPEPVTKTRGKDDTGINNAANGDLTEVPEVDEADNQTAEEDSPPTDTVPNSQ